MAAEVPEPPPPAPPPAAAVPEVAPKTDLKEDTNTKPQKPGLFSESDTPEERAAKEKKLRDIVAKTPGAEIFTEGMKVPGQEEREEKEAEWMRGDFDPIGDLVVTGIRLVRGEGRSAEMATGPQCEEWDDLFITLRGSPVEGSYDTFFAPRGAEAALANRPETKWLVQLSDPRLTDYWRKSFRAMSKGDLCRFTCAAKKSQAWLQCLADCCLSIGGDGGADGRGAEDSRLAQSHARVQVQPSNRVMVVEVQLDSWLPCKNVASRKQPSLYKRILRYSTLELSQQGKSEQQRLEEQLKYTRTQHARSTHAARTQHAPSTHPARTQHAPSCLTLPGIALPCDAHPCNLWPTGPTSILGAGTSARVGARRTRAMSRRQSAGGASRVRPIGCA